MTKQAGTGMKIRGKAGLAVITALVAWLAVSQPGFAESGTAAEEIRKEIMREQLRNSEVYTVKKAVDKALNDAEELDLSFSVDEILQNAVNGRPLDRLEGLPSALLGLFGKELKGNVILMAEMFGVMLLAALFKGLQPKDDGISNEAVKLALNGAMAVMAAASFGGVVRVAQGAIDSMQTLASVAMPALYAMLAASGQVISATALQAIVLAGVNLACHVFKTVLLPLAVMAGVLFLLDSISARFRLKNLAKLLKTITVWSTAAITLVFSIAVNIQRITGVAVDAAAAKTAKFAIGMLPVAGKNMSDAAETILACAAAVRNAAGAATVIGLGVIFAVPFVKVFVMMLIYRLVAAFGAPLGNDGICSALEEAAGCMSVMIGIMGASLFVLVLLAGTMMSGAGFA